MLVILRENVKNLGRVGDVVKVSAGFARNFLLPKKKGIAAGENNLAVIEHHKKTLEKKRATERAAAEEVAKKLKDYTVTIARKVGEQDKLFGSVSTADIAHALQTAGYTVERRDIVLENPIKSLGSFPVVVNFDQEVSATIKVWVVKEEG
jgi:large subunit ribosomal protein L9